MRLFELDDDRAYAVAIVLWAVAGFYPSPEDLLFVILLVMGASIAYGKIDNAKLLFPFLYPTASFLFLLSLYQNGGISIFAWMVLVVAVTDIAAFFVGRTIGRHPFCSTSPNKTIEGALGGVLAATLTGGFVGEGLFGLYIAGALAAVTSFAAIYGDLFESYLKRRANVKDSGTILPGHGGILDRMDGYLFAAVALALILRLLTHLGVV